MNKIELNKLWHSSAHILAYAIKNLYPDIVFGLGPAIDNGFYYDFDNLEIKEDDLENIEEEMKKIINKNHSFNQNIINKDQALKIFEKNKYKKEIIQDLNEEKLSIYTIGDFVDLCSGPHIDNVKSIKAFKLIRISGAYWKGDSKNKMLTRIYGISYDNNLELKKYLYMIEEAKKRDHRKLGKELGLFSQHPEAPGAVFWHDKGLRFFNAVLDYWRKIHRKYGYLEINTPQIMDRELWEKSGHWNLYKENMYTTKAGEKEFAIKPMSCPGNILFYKEKIHSYKEFPLRIAELGTVHRYELSGVLHGSMRVRQMTQDDAHIYVTPEMLENEITNILEMAFEMLQKFGFDKFDIEVGVRSEKKKNKYLGNDEDWYNAENSLKNALKRMNLSYIISEGEAKFYGPCIDIMIKDSIGRKWQCSTLQLDFNLPKRFNLEYIDENSEKKVPIMLHRTLLGTLERFLGILIEHHAGVFPEWVAPVQIAVIPISENNLSYARKIIEYLENKNLRSELIEPKESLSKRIRNSMKQKIPYTVILGDNEMAKNKISYRKYGKKETKIINIEDFRID